jgi:hypothetical protein
MNAMKPAHFLTVILLSILFSGCRFAIPSQTSAARGNDQTASSETSEAQGKIKTERSNARSNKTAAKPKPAANAVCPLPDKPCHHKEREFADWELTFRLPAKIVANKGYSSAPFYAVLLKTYDMEEDCDGGEYIEAVERERKRLQNLQLERKVFAFYSCPNMDSVGYEFDGLMDAAKERFLIMNFLAIYAGETKEEAEALRKNLLDEYPNAVVKRMTANYSRLEQ